MIASSTLLALSAGVWVTTAAASGPPCKVGDVVRAGALNSDVRILAFDRGKGLYHVKEVRGGLEDWYPARLMKTCTGEEAPPVTEAYFVGTWELSTGGGGAYVKKGNEYKATWLNTAKAPPLVVRADHSYTWTIDSRTVVKGAWHVAQPDEIKHGYDKRGLTILLERGEDGKDWLVTRELAFADKGRDSILIERKDLGLTYVGRKK